MTVDWKKKLLPNLPYLLFVYLFDNLEMDATLFAYLREHPPEGHSLE